RRSSGRRFAAISIAATGRLAIEAFVLPNTRACEDREGDRTPRAVRRCRGYQSEPFVRLIMRTSSVARRRSGAWLRIGDKELGIRSRSTRVLPRGTFRSDG